MSRPTGSITVLIVPRRYESASDAITDISTVPGSVRAFAGVSRYDAPALAISARCAGRRVMQTGNAAGASGKK
jgi:hypothetical protein